MCASLPPSSLFGFIASQHEGRKRAGPEDRRTYARHLRGARIINQHVRPKTRADGGGPSFDYTPPRALLFLTFCTEDGVGEQTKFEKRSGPWEGPALSFLFFLPTRSPVEADVSFRDQVG